MFVPDAVVEHDIRPSDWRASLREAWSWSDLPAVVGRHPQVRRELLHHRVWWKPSHPLALLAAGGLLGAVALRRPAPLLALGPWLRHRVVVDPAPGSPRRRLASLPGQLAVDLVEVGAVARGSVRHRSLML